VGSELGFKRFVFLKLALQVRWVLVAIIACSLELFCNPRFRLGTGKNMPGNYAGKSQFDKIAERDKAA